MEKTNSRRIEYIDAMRGFTMMLVVYSHVILFILNTGVSDIDVFFISFRMPLFFFISGLMAYSPLYHKDLYRKRVKNRIYGQLIPTFTVGILYALANNVAIIDFLLNEFKLGYWFTFCMFQIFLIYATLTFFLDKLSLSNTSKTIAYLILIILSYIIFALLKYKTNAFDSSALNFISAKLTLRYIPFFFAGIICKTYFDFFCRLLNNNYVFSLIFIFDIVLFTIFGLTPLTFPILGLGGIIIVYKFFHFYQAHFSKTTIIGKTLCYIGRHTLEIYLMHYFIVAGFSHIDKCALFSWCANNWGLELIVGLSLSIVIICFCFMVMYILKTAPLLNKVLFGIKKA